jgi:hypothetical protein
MWGYGTEEQRQLFELQRQLFARTVEAEIESARLAHKIIPTYPLDASARAVSADRFDYGTGRVDDQTQLALEELARQFSLTRQQAEDTSLASAAVVIRRAAQELAREHDDRVFRVAIRNSIVDAFGPEAKTEQKANFNLIQPHDASDVSGDSIVSATASAVATLDKVGYRTSYVMVAGQEVYRRLHSRAAGAADLPMVAVRGLLEDGPVHRSGVLDPNEALIMSLGMSLGAADGPKSDYAPIDRAVAVEPRTEFLRIEEEVDSKDKSKSEELRTWELNERFITRFKETKSVVLLQPETGGTQQPETAGHQRQTRG